MSDALRKAAREKAAELGKTLSVCRNFGGGHEKCGEDGEDDHAEQAILSCMAMALDAAESNRTGDCVNCQGASMRLERLKRDLETK